MSCYRYRLTEVVTRDFGDTPAAGKMVSGVLSVIPDGTPWHNRPATISIGVPEGTRPGGLYRVVIERINEGDA
jgi:hypothetical protein